MLTNPDCYEKNASTLESQKEVRGGRGGFLISGEIGTLGRGDGNSDKIKIKDYFEARSNFNKLLT